MMDIDHGEDVLWGQVEGEDADIPEIVTIRLSEDSLSFNCECSEVFANGVCRHVIAVLCKYADQYGETDKLLTATDGAIKDRIKRGRSEVEVVCQGGKDLWFGNWTAESLGGASHYSKKYRVTIRSLQQRANYCTCPDFATNQLGTCKHIEAVLHKISKHPQFEIFQQEPAPFPYVYLAWDVDDAPQIMLHRPAEMTDKQHDLLKNFFSASGTFTGRLPEDFFHFMDLADNRRDIYIGEDAVSFTRQIATGLSHKQRSVEIKKQIQSSRRIPGIKARLYPYQIEGVSFLAGTGRALLADDMGLGKTLQAISAAVWLKEHEGIRKILIICPASLKQQWAREIAKFTDLETQVIQGGPAQRGVQYRRDCNFFVLNYELLLRDLTIINETISPDLIILDEAQRIKNWRTKIASAVKQLSSRYAFVLTGTPLENRLEDLYSLMQVVDPKILGPLWRYMIDFHITDKRDKVLGYRNLSMLRKRLEPVMLRRDRRIVKDQLPDRITSQIDVPMTEKQVELHGSAMRAAGRLATIAKRRPLTLNERNKLMAALQQARMACDAAGLVDKETEGSPKIDELENILQEVCLQSGLKVVIFSQWRMMTEMVESRLRQMDIGYVSLHGSVPTAKRGDLMDAFQNDDSIQVFLSTDAGGLGLNLQSGSVLVNLDVPWNPAILEQRNGRIHRLGQTKTVQLITMVAAESYEEHVLSLVHSKQDLFDNVIAEDGDQDVVGVSKKLLETLVADLPGDFHGDTPKKQEADKDEPTLAETVAELDFSDATPQTDDTREQELTACIEELQKQFGLRIERILGVDGGLLTVLDQVTTEDDQIAENLSGTIPVAMIDARTLAGLARLGGGSPVAEQQVLYKDTGQETAEPAASGLQLLAAEKLKAATVLLGQNCTGVVLELLLSALLATASAQARLKKVVMPQDAGVWLYSEALPKGFLTQDDAALIMRTMALAQSPSVPENMLNDLCLDVELFISA
ncbi:MAG: DEAD/DEAH box helicase [Desulfocapsa sp.]|nr:DEAD/DEAH box helicase [Desulfocapsa sp.]